MRLVLLGPPGAGKGTQGQRLALSYSVPHVATGEMIRDEIARRTAFGRAVEAAVEQGEFAPDEAMIQAVSARLSQADASSGYVLDGFPRNVPQAQALDRWCAEHSAPLNAVVELTISEAALVERLAGRLVCPVCDTSYHRVHKPPLRAGVCDREGAALVRRPDDEPVAIMRRLQVYETATVPLRAYYGAQGLLISINAAGDEETVQQRIASSLPLAQTQAL